LPLGSAASVVDLDQAIRTAWVEEKPELLTAGQLASRVRERFDPRLLQQAIDLHVVRPVGGGSYQVPSPTLLRVAEPLVSLGVPVSSSLAALGDLEQRARLIARRFITLFLRDIQSTARAQEPNDR